VKYLYTARMFPSEGIVVRHLLSLLYACLLAAGQASAAPAPKVPTGPSADAVRQIEARRVGLRPFELLDVERLPVEQRAEMLSKMEPALKDLATALASRDTYVFVEVVRDLVNGHYRGFPRDRILALLLPRLKVPETHLDRMVSQGFIMEHLARWYGPRARAALPDLLGMVSNDRVSTYLRGQAVTAAARIGPGDEEVIKTFIAALNNPNPKSESGVHDRIAERLGEMGKAATPAKPALGKLLTRHPWYQDVAFLALGKIDRDERPGPLADYLGRLGKLDRIPPEQAAVAFLHLVEAGKIPAAPGRRESVDPEVAKAARPVLLKIVEDRQDDVYSRAALRALRDLGPGSGPRAVRALTRILLRSGSTLACEALERLEPTDPEAVAPLAEAFAKGVTETTSWHIPRVLADQLARYGKAARPAVPTALQALRQFRASPSPGDAYADQFASYLSILTAVGGDEPGARRLVIDLLDPAGDVLKRSAPHATPEYQVHLLRTLATLGLPAEGADRKLALMRIREGLASDLTPVFSGAAGVVITAKPSAREEAGPLVPLLARVLAPGFKFKAPRAGIAEGPSLLGQRLALQALASLGSQSRDALPAVKALADQTLEKRTSDYLPDPPINAVILEARKAVQAIR
jgi:hypothetical protein